MINHDAFAVKPGTRVRLGDFDPRGTPGCDDKSDGVAAFEKELAKLIELQYLMWAENRHSLLIVLQGMDGSGKDGAIRDVLRGVDPQGVRVTSFKQPSQEELEHDFLWRIHKATPARGEIAVFNRSHYESVIVERVKNLVPEADWRPRYDLINSFEELLARAGTVVLKFYLNISHEEQLQRLNRRMEDPKRNWKFNAGDFEERKLWDRYMEAYEEAISRCTTAHAPWHIIPADRKWYRNLAITRIVVHAMERLNMQWPVLNRSQGG